MDDVSSVYITYNFLRIPKHRSCNLLAYAARFAIIINGNVFLEIDDCAILDFSIQLYKWFNAEGIDFVFVPMDDEAKVLEISSLNDNEYMLSSEWSEMGKVVISKENFDKAVTNFIECFKNDFAQIGGNFSKEVKRYI